MLHLCVVLILFLSLSLFLSLCLCLYLWRILVRVALLFLSPSCIIRLWSCSCSVSLFLLQSCTVAARALLTSLAHFSHLFALSCPVSLPLILRLVISHIFAWPFSFNHVLAFFWSRPCFRPRYDLCLCLCLYFCQRPVHFKS